MKLPGIDWDESKNAINKERHSGLSFEVAQYVFLDPLRIEHAGMKARGTRPGKNGVKPWAK
jgi:uncharacterized DUF497 family protein